MSLQVLVVQPGSPSGQFLINLFRERGDQAWLAADPAQSQILFEHVQPDLLVIDVHRLAEDWSQTLPAIQRQYPQLKVLFTTDYPDPLLESKIQTQYASPAW